MSELLVPFRSRYFISGEVNSEVDDAQARIDAILAAHPQAEIGHLDGITDDYPDWHFSVRSSNT